MGFLDDLKKRMSTPGADRFSEERFKQARPKVTPREGAAQTRDVTPPLLVDVEAEARRRHRRFVFSVALGVSVIVIAGGTVFGIRWYRETHTVGEKTIGLKVEAPESVLSGADVTYRIIVRNNSRVIWNNVTLEAKVPENIFVKNIDPQPASAAGAVTWDLGTLRPKASVTFAILGRLVGEEGTSPTLTATVILTPENAPGTKVDKAQFAAVRVQAVPVDLAIEAPKQAASGENMKVHVAYQNRTRVDLTGARVVVTPPAGFTVEATNPLIAGRDLAWDLPPIPQQGEGSVSIAGFLEGNPDDARSFKVAIGFLTPDGKFVAQREVQTTTTITRRALTITQEFQKRQDILKANPGEMVPGKVLYKNTGNVGLRDVIVELKFEGKGLDGRTVETTGGFYNSGKETITWTASSVPQLKTLRPGESGELVFKFKILSAKDLPFTSELDKNFSLVSRVTADSPDIPTPIGQPKEIFSDRFEILLNSVLTLAIDGFFDDGRAGLPVSTGPVPPRVGEETITTIRARVSNTSNDVVDAVYRTKLPEGIRWTDNKYTTSGDVAYNPRAREVTWNIGAIPARAGTGLPGPEFSFQVGLTPSLNQVGKEVPLTRGHSVEGTDVFTAARLQASADALTTRDSYQKNGGVVR